MALAKGTTQLPLSVLPAAVRAPLSSRGGEALNCSLEQAAGIFSAEKWFLFCVNGLSLSLAAAAVIGSAATTVAQSSPRDYPQWRGRNRDGEASAFLQPKLWPENLTRRWKVDVGEGYATPIVVCNIV
jgi:hypothetical protein